MSIKTVESPSIWDAIMLISRPCKVEHGFPMKVAESRKIQANIYKIPITIQYVQEKYHNVPNCYIWL